MKFFILFSNIFILFFITSCSKTKKETKVFVLDKNIEFNLDKSNLNNSNSNSSKKLEYNFKAQKDIIKYKLKSLQLFTSKNNQILLTVSFIINFKKSEDKKNNFKYKIYFSNFKIKHKVYNGYFDFNTVNKKYNLIMNALYFNILINSYGNKSFEIENKVGLNSNLKSMASFIFNIINYIFLEFPTNKIENSNFIFTDKKYELTSNYSENGSLLLKYDSSNKINFNIEYKNDFIILKSDDKKKKIRILFSEKEKMPQKINLLFEDKDKLKFENKEYTYSLKNYYFIEKI